MPHEIERVRVVDLRRAEVKAIIKKSGRVVRFVWRCKACLRFFPYDVVIGRMGCPMQAARLEEAGLEAESLCEDAAHIHDDEQHAGEFSACELPPCAAAHEMALDELRVASARAWEDWA